MTLTTHAVVGGLVGAFVGVPTYSFGLGVASHFALDSIPHWDYKLFSKKETTNHLDTDMSWDKNFLKDFGEIFLDMFLGFGLILVFAVLVPELPFWPMFFGAIGGVLPDFMQFMYFKIRKEPLKTLQRFHIWIHAPKETGLSFVPGFYYQFTLVVAIICLMVFLSLY